MTACCADCEEWGPLYPSGACRCQCHAFVLDAGTLAAIRTAADPQAPTVISWRPMVREALEWPALAPFMQSPQEAARREFAERLMREYVQVSLLLTPHPSVGNVVPAEGETT